MREISFKLISIVVGSIILLFAASLFTVPPVRQAVLGENQNLIPLLTKPESIDADTINGQPIEYWLKSNQPLNAATLNGQPGLHYLDAANLTGNIVTDRFSAYADLQAEGHIASDAVIITNQNISDALPEANSEAQSTDELTEGAIHLFFTQSRVSANDDVEANTAARHDAVTITDSETLDLNLVGQKLTGSVIQSGLKTSLFNNDAGFISSLAGLTTDNLNIGSSNLYSQWTNTASGIAFANRVGIGSSDDPTATLDITGSLAVSGAITAASFTTNGGLLFTNSSGVIAQLSAGVNGQCLKSSGSVPAWGACAAGDSITGTGSEGELAFFNSSSTLSGASDIIWDALNGVLSMAGSIIPAADITYDLGSPERQWKDVFIGPGSLYINGQKVLQDEGDSIKVTADPGQNLVIQTDGTGDIEFSPLGTGVIALKGNIELSGDKFFRTSDNSAVNFSDGVRAGNLALSGNLITTVNTNGDIEIAPNGNGNTYISSGSVGIGTTDAEALLDVAGDMRIGTSTSNAISFGTSDASSGAWIRNDGSVGTVFSTHVGNMYIGYNGSAKDLIFYPGGSSESFRLNADGSAVLGNLTTNGGLLHTNSSGVISQTATGTAGQCLQSAGGGSPTWGSCNSANTMTGTGAAGQVTFFNGANTATGDNSFFWNNSTKRLGINRSGNPGATLDVLSSETTANAGQIAANSLTTGKGLAISSTSTGMTTGGLLGLSWMPGSATTMTGDLFSINVGPHGTVGNLLNLMNDGLSVFSVSQSQIVANVPVAFRAAGNMSVAHDLIFTNSTSANINSASPMRITAGEVFNSSDLTLATYNNGAVVFDSATVATANTTNLGIGLYLPSAALHIRAGESSAGGAPIKLTVGTNLTTPEAGAIEFDGTYLYITDSTDTRRTLLTADQQLTITNKTVGSGGLAWSGVAEPALSDAGTAKTYFDATSNTFKISENGGVYVDMLAANRPLQTPLSTKTGAYTITETDSIILADTSGGTYAVTLPTAVGITGKQYTIKQMTASGFATVETNGSETIDGAANYAFSAQYEAITVASNGANWVIISKK